jgi:hypothetical protein
MDIDQMKIKLEEKFGSRYEFLGHQIFLLSMTGQTCDITFFKKEPVVDIKIDPQISLSIMYGAGANRLNEMLHSIKLSDGKSINIDDIWTINPMPEKGFSKDELDKINLLKGEEIYGPNGETLRKMIGDTYHCKNRDDEDYYLRRFIAS